MQEILNAYNLSGARSVLFGTGLINRTWKITIAPSQHYILQKINEEVFKNPRDIDFNQKLIGDYLSKKHPGYFFPRPVLSNSGEEMIFVKGQGYFRLFPFVPGSHTDDIVRSPDQAHEAASQFGRFTHLLSGFNEKQLKITIPDFHNLSLRLQNFERAIKEGNAERVKDSVKLIQFLLSHRVIADEFHYIMNDPSFKQRVTHHDTKISNVLFNKNNKGICVIDLDTVMPGYFISDTGDMMRTYLSPVNEEEIQFDRISIRKEYFEAIADGYLYEMKKEFTKRERSYFVYSGKFMTYMQSLRFLTDHLEDDRYYGASYVGQNFMRAKNQAVLLERLIDKEKDLERMV
jgi:Ser/Thr protein kinase RdoA (MazF antagonist)